MASATAPSRALPGIFRPARRPLTTAAVTLVTGLVLLTVGVFLRTRPVDLGAVVVLNRAHTGAWAVIADAVYRGLGPVPAVVLTVVLAAVVWGASRSLRTAIAFGAVVALTWLPVAVLKILVDRPRPDAAMLAHVYTPGQTDGSFPSGHTAFLAALTMACWYLLRGTRWAGIVTAAGALATALVGVAVVSDGLHYPTDALASVAWALAMAPTARWLVADVALARLGRRAPAPGQAGVPRR